MATVRLGRHTSEEEDLPDVCLRCGAPTTLRVTKVFSWHPWWVYLGLLIPLIYRIMREIMIKRRTVSAPLCPEHRRHWFWRTLIRFLCPLGVVGLLVIAGAVSLNARPGQYALVIGVWAGVPLGLLAWVVTVIWLQRTAIRPTEITDYCITLTGVSEEFVRAYEEWLPDPDRLDRAVRERWGRKDRRAGREDRFEALDEPEERRNSTDTYRKG